MKAKAINILGFEVEIHDFRYKKYMYPSFNGNAEFEVSKEGFKKMYHYLRFVRWAREVREQIFNSISC